MLWIGVHIGRTHYLFPGDQLRIYPVVIGIVGFGFIRCCGNGFNLKGHSQDTKFTLLYSSLEFAFAHSE